MSSTDDILIRPIRQHDNPHLARIIRDTLTEFKANKPGTVYYDETTDHLFEVFEEPGSAYLVAVKDDEILGGSGIYPTKGLPDRTCELVKMYLVPEARGKGIGKRLMEECIIAALELNYKAIYLETMPELVSALPLYEKFGFKYVPDQIGESGHTGCSLFMMKDIA